MGGMMDRVAGAHGMDDTVWARHANPWSGLTRLPILPLMTLALWARVWIGWWCLLPLTLLVAWTWWNPRAFPPPQRTDGWLSEAVMGERVWLNTAHIPIPAHHARAAIVLQGIAAAGMGPLLYGLWALSVWPVLMGLALTLLGKLWFLDRMVWLYRDMAAVEPTYRAWARSGSSA